MAQSSDECNGALWAVGANQLSREQTTAPSPVLRPLPHTVGCHNDQCRVAEFYPSSDGTGRCPACYGG